MKIIIICLVTLFLSSCNTESEKKDISVLRDNYFQIKGFAQGTTYSIIYNDSLQRDLSFQIDSLLKDYDSYLSIYVDTSLISRFNSGVIRTGYPTEWENRTQSHKLNKLGIFEECFVAAKEVYKNTEGAFNPTVYPLIKYWGFLDIVSEKTISQKEIDSILKLVDFSDSMIQLDYESNYYTQPNDSSQVINKGNGKLKLDFNGIAQGHSVDIIGRYLKSLKIENYMIEIGGEVLCKGVNNKNTPWHIGIDKPIENSSPGSEGFQLIVNVKDKAVATSGNYRKFYEKEGVKYAHTMNPKTGYPVTHSLLSVTVVADKCVFADGYATAFMVMGKEKTKLFIQSNPELGLEVYLVASQSNGDYAIWMSEGFENLIQN